MIGSRTGCELLLPLGGDDPALICNASSSPDPDASFGRLLLVEESLERQVDDSSFDRGGFRGSVRSERTATGRNLPERIALPFDHLVAHPAAFVTSTCEATALPAD